jgi:Ni/Co efflux regulator RcnB
MKKTFLIGALIAATLAPVAAEAQGYGDRARERQEARQDRRDDAREWRQRNREDRREWRQDNREDWQRWRDSHRNDYRRGNWTAPFRYRRFNTGVIVPRSYWGTRYYVNNWSAYRLPRPAYGYYRYVRHFDDLLLINTRNGRVIRVYHDFYW